MDWGSASDLLLTRTWWRYVPGPPSPVEATLHAFNLFEGSVWVVLAGMVLARYLRRRRSAIEVGYALAFVAFALTDFREAYGLPSWLIWAKIANLAILFRLRSVVIRRFYPGSRLY